MNMQTNDELKQVLAALGESAAPPSLIEKMRGCQTQEEITVLADLVQAYQHGFTSALEMVRIAIGVVEEK